MYINDSMIHGMGGFELDAANIGSVSTDNNKIRLPYNGPLPADLSASTGAALSVTFNPGLTVSVLLIVERDGKNSRYPVKTTPEEIDRILRPFFFDGNGRTRYDNGLERYSLGFWQSSYINWQRLTLDENGLDNLLSQLSPGSVERVLQHIRHSETA